MRCYQLVQSDQKHSNWLMFNRLKVPPFVELKSEYKDLCCSLCDRYDHDLVFERGFESPTDLRVKGDITGTEDGFLCLNENVKSVIEANNFQGVSLKPLPVQGWFVAKIKCLVEADRSVYKHEGNICARCGRCRGTYGTFSAESQIKCPSKTGTFFAPVFPRVGMMIFHRDVFVTEDIVFAMKQAGIKGAYCDRLRNEDEDAKFKAALAAKLGYKSPRGAKVYL